VRFSTISNLLQNLGMKKIEIQLRFDRTMATRLLSRFMDHSVVLTLSLISYVLNADTADKSIRHCIKLSLLVFSLLYIFVCYIIHNE